MPGRTFPVPRSESGTGLDAGARRIALVAGLALLLSALFAACGDGDAGLTRAEVEEIVRAEMAGALTEADVEDAVRRAIAETARPEPGLSRAEVEEIARAAVAGIPSRSAPAEYTRHVVANAISRYRALGLDATLAHYNRPESIDGQWYVFIIDENDLVIGHPDPERRGLDLKGWVGTDANGYEFGPDMLSATEEGKWVSYVYRNPESGGITSNFADTEVKNVWVVRHDGLLFASGWYIDSDEFTRMLVSIAVDRFREGGLPATVAYFASPGSALAGLEAAVAYYNEAETVDGRWFAFIGDPGGRIAAHSDPSMIGGDVQDLFGAATLQATGDGDWVESESLRVWVADYDGYVFGSGWHRDESGSEWNPLADTEWRLIELGKADSPAAVVGGNPTAEFSTTADMTGWTGCNSYDARYSVRQSELRLDDLGWTEAKCPSQALFRQEQRMQDSLATVERFEVSGERLTLHSEGGQALVFERVGR